MSNRSDAVEFSKLAKEDFNAFFTEILNVIEEQQWEKSCPGIDPKMKGGGNGSMFRASSFNPDFCVFFSVQSYKPKRFSFKIFHDFLHVINNEFAAIFHESQQL